MATRTFVSLVISLAILASLSGLTMKGNQVSRPDIGTATIQDLAFIAGRWTTRQGDDQFLEEHWGAPLANAMTGMFRWQRGDAIWLYEFLLIEQTEAGITYHLRHFVPGSIGWEEKDAPLSYPLKEVRHNEAVFEHPERDDPKRFIFTRKGDALTITIESIKADEVSKNVFSYKLTQ